MSLKNNNLSTSFPLSPPPSHICCFGPLRVYARGVKEVWVKEGGKAREVAASGPTFARVALVWPGRRNGRSGRPGRRVRNVAMPVDRHQ